jgi:hypothetical protein
MSKFLNSLGKFVFLFVVFHLLFLKNAYAYLDPGTGSYLFQLTIAGLIGLLFTVKTFWRRIKAFFNNLFSKLKKVKNSG